MTISIRIGPKKLVFIKQIRPLHYSQFSYLPRVMKSSWLRHRNRYIHIGSGSLDRHRLGHTAHDQAASTKLRHFIISSEATASVLLAHCKTNKCIKVSQGFCTFTLRRLSRPRWPSKSQVKFIVPTLKFYLHVTRSGTWNNHCQRKSLMWYEHLNWGLLSDRQRVKSILQMFN